MERNAAATSPFFHVLQKRAIAWFGPRLNRAFIQRFAGVRHDEIQVEVDGIAETLAAWARAVRIVERKQARLGLLIKRAIVLAFETFVEGKTLRRITGRILDELQDGFAVALAIANFDGVREARAGFGIHGEAIDENVDGLREIHVEQRFGRGEFMDAAVLIKAVEAALLDVAKSLLESFLRRRRRFLLGHAACSAGRLRLCNAEGIKDVEAAAGSERRSEERRVGKECRSR